MNGAMDNLVGLCWWCHLQMHGKSQRTLELEDWMNGLLALGDTKYTVEQIGFDGRPETAWWRNGGIR